MLAKVSWPNIITLSRLPLLFILVALLYLPGPEPHLVALALLPVLYLMDWFDGYLARSINQVTALGGVLDIAIDRVVENVLWIAFAHLGLVPLWVPLVFITRSFVVDGLRSFALSKGKSAFGMMHSGLGRFLVASRFMRGFYGGAKAGAFCALALNLALRAMEQAPAGAHLTLYWLQQFLVYCSVVLCVARGVPVLWDIRALLQRPHL